MKSTLRKGERCPVHQSYFCCGREGNNRTGRKAWQRQVRQDFRVCPKWELVGRGVWRIKDEHHSRGYRERRNRAAMTILLKQKIADQDCRCALCGEKFDDYRLIVPEHIAPKGMGSARRDDHPDNIQAAHNWPCNAEKGSRRIA